MENDTRVVEIHCDSNGPIYCQACNINHMRTRKAMRSGQQARVFIIERVSYVWGHDLSSTPLQSLTYVPCSFGTYALVLDLPACLTASTSPKRTLFQGIYPCSQHLMRDCSWPGKSHLLRFPSAGSSPTQSCPLAFGSGANTAFPRTTACASHLRQVSRCQGVL